MRHAAARSRRETNEMKRTSRFILLVVLLGEAGCHDLERSRSIDNPAVAGRTIALQICSNCHGANGVSVSPMFPKLAAQPQAYLVAQITDFKVHRRADPNAKQYMWGFRHLSETQIQQIAAYFASQPPPRAKSGDPRLIDKGRAIYSAGLPGQGVPACSSCHGMHGEGAGEIPRLASQHADYTFKQLMVFRDRGQRPRGEAMQALCDKMSEQDMRAVAAFLQALQTDNAAGANQSTAHN